MIQVVRENERGEIYVVNATVVERHALQTGNPGAGSKQIRPMTVRLEDGQEITVYDDEGDARVLPGERGPARQGKYGWSYTKTCA